VAELRVFATNACDSIPGCNIKIENFLPRMWSAVTKGFIPHADGVQLQDGTCGASLGVDVDQITGHRWFSNYECATTVGRAGVAAAVAKRVDAGKTLALGPMGHAAWRRPYGRCAFTSSCIFPMGAVAKALLPGQTPEQLEWRPALQAIIPAPASTRPPT